MSVTAKKNGNFKLLGRIVQGGKVILCCKRQIGKIVNECCTQAGHCAFARDEGHVVEGSTQVSDVSRRRTSVALFAGRVEGTMDRTKCKLDLDQ